MEVFLIFFIILNPSVENVNEILNSMMFMVGLGAVTIFLLLEILVALLWRTHFLLYNQLVFYRYGIFPGVLLFLAW